jgi:predicted Zn-dependent protease
MRKLFLAILCLTALLLLGYSGYRSYETWKQKHLVSMAQQFAAKSDLRNARLSLTELLRLNPQNIEASRFMADLSETDELSTTLFWRKRVVVLAPRSSKDRLALAEIAVKMHDLPSAAEALNGIQEADRNTALYHNIAGSWCAAANQLPMAEAHFEEAISLEPKNLALELSLAVLRLHETNTAAEVEARNTLNRLSSNPTNSTLRCQALRELTIDAIQHHQKNASLALASQLVQETNSLFTDRLLRLEAFRETGDPAFKIEMANLQREAESDSSKIQELIMWQLGKIPPGESLSWLRSLPMATQISQPVAQLKAECCVALQDWSALLECVEKPNWGELEFVRHAFRTRALRGQGFGDAANVEWKQTLEAANGQEVSLVMLLRLAAQWGWASEGEEILQTIVNKYPSEEWARQALAKALFASGQTRSLMQLYSQQASRDPSDHIAKNTLAITALLLDAQELKPHQLALELYQESPTNLSFVSTYAFSLYLQGKKTEALKVLDRLDSQQLETAAVAPCYGLVLKAIGDRAKAKKYLDLASKFAMLPEERKIIDGAKMEIDQTITPKS